MNLLSWGSIGHLLVLLVGVSAVCAVVAFYASVRAPMAGRPAWRRYAHTVFFVHTAALLGAITVLYVLILNNHFEYHYVWAHTMRALPLQYKISCFWEGQEGSFLLWMFWNAIIGLVVLRTNSSWRYSLMPVLCLVQVFLSAMVLGLVIGPVKIGSSPFLMLRDVIAAPVFADNPAFVPEDGTGLNPLLQNYWMVIHPPVLFAGFALTTLPFAYATAALWRGAYTQWIAAARPAMLWTVLVLAVGIMMGAYWAYETLNFGGYWNWDPVENAVYIPWLVAVAALHGMRMTRASRKHFKTTLVLSALPFLLVLYATFLVRSGILGNTSVHAFTDLGLSEQLILLCLFFTLLFGFLFWRRRPFVPVTTTPFSWYRADTWMLMGIALLCLMGFQVLIPTSIPLFNAVVQLLGGDPKMAPPADQVSFYSKYQLVFALFLLVLSATAQLLWWRRAQNRKELRMLVLMPLLGSLAGSSLLAMIVPIQNVAWILLLAAGLYAILASLRVLLVLAPRRLSHGGGTLAHIGIALMVLGLLSSSGYSKKTSVNRTGLIWHEDFPEEINRENILLFQHESRAMQDFSLYYSGACKEVAGLPFYVPEAHITPTSDEHYGIAKKDLVHKGRGYAKAGDTLHMPESNKRYFEIQYVPDKGGDTLRLFPRAQRVSEENILYSPYIVRGWHKDLYTHVRTFSDPGQREWSEPEQLKVRIGESFFVNDYVAALVRLQPLPSWEGLELDTGDIVIKAHIRILGARERYMATPVFIIKDGQVGYVLDDIEAVGARLTLQAIHPEEDAFTLGIQTTQKPWVILEIMEKPLINFVWLGLGFLVLGVLLAWKRRS